MSTRDQPGRPLPLTGWNVGDIRRTMNIETASAPIERQWYQRLWAN